MPSADDSFKPDKIIKAKKGESSWKVAANERAPGALGRFAPSEPGSCSRTSSTGCAGRASAGRE